MRPIQTTARVDPGGTLTARVPADVPAGEHEVVLVLAAESVAQEERERPLDFPVDDCGPWPENLSLRREDMYGDWGR